MPEIRDYQSQVRAAGPVDFRSAKGEDAGSQIGQGLQSVGEAADSASDVLLKHQSMLETSDLTAKMSQAVADQTENLQNRIKSADPGDTNFISDFKTDFDQTMDQIGDTLETPLAKKQFEVMRAEQTHHFLTQAMAGQAELVKEKVLLDRQTTLNGFENQLRMNPDSMDVVQSLYKQSQDAAIAAGLPREKIFELERKEMPQLWHAKVVGDIDRDPQKAILDLQTGMYGDKVAEGEVETLISHAHQVINANDAAQERRERLQEKAQKKIQTATQADFLKKLENDELTPEDVLSSKLAPFGAGSQEQFLNLIKNKGQDELKDNSQFVPLFQAIHKPDGDPAKLVDENQLAEKVGQGLTPEGYKTLLQEMQGAHTTAGKGEKQVFDTFLANTKRAMSTSNDLLRIKDVQGDKNYEDWLLDFLPKYQKARSAGKSPNDLLNSKSEDFLGNNIVPKKGTDVIQSNIQYSNGILKPSAGPLTLPPESKSLPPIIPKDQQWKPGESAADVLKRLGR